MVLNTFNRASLSSKLNHKPPFLSLQVGLNSLLKYHTNRKMFLKYMQRSTFSPTLKVSLVPLKFLCAVSANFGDQN